MSLLTREAAVTLRDLPFSKMTECGERLMSAIYADDTRIGNLTIYDVPGRHFCYLKHLDVDHRFHHMGFRRRAVQKLIDSLRHGSRFKEIVVTISPTRADLIHFFQAMGFFNSGEFIEGEYVFKLSLYA